MRTALLETDPRQWPGPRLFGGFLALALAAVFPGIVLGAKTFFARDYGVIAYPCVHFAHEAFWRGEIPGWNPLSNCGAPFLAQWGTMACYPGSLFYLLLPLPWSLGVFCLAHLWLAGLGMYALASRWTDNRWAASVAGLAFVFNGVTLSCLMWPNYTVVLAWMPWLVLWLERAWREGGSSLGWAIAAATFQLLVGVPELVVLTWVLIGVLGVVEVGRGALPMAQAARRTLVVVLASAGLAAVQLLPFLELVGRSQRTLEPIAMKWAMPAWGWANLLAPLFHNVRTFQSQYYQHGQEFLSSYYLGAGVLVAAIAALWRSREPRAWLLGGLTVWTLIMALGDQGYLYSALRHAFPAMGLARYPIKFVLLAGFTVPLLAAFLLARLERPRAADRGPEWRALAVLGALALAAMAAIVWWGARYPLPFDQWPAMWRNTVARGVWLVLFLGLAVCAARTSRAVPRAVARIGVAAVLLGDFFTHTSWQNPVLDASLLAPGVARLDPMPRWGQGRVLISPEAERLLLQSRVPKWDADLLGKRLALWSNLNVIEDVPKVNGSSTLQVAEQAQVQRLFYETNAVPLPRLADFLGVSQETASNSVVEWTPRTGWLPPMTAGQAPVFLDGPATLQALKKADFDPRRTVYLPPEVQEQIGATEDSSAKVEQARFEAQRIEAEVTSARPALVVVAQSYYPAWRAMVDGAQVPLWRANHAFQAFQVPAGTHRVELVYRDRAFTIGAAISVGTLVVLLTVATQMRKRARTDKERATAAA